MHKKRAQTHIPIIGLVSAAVFLLLSASPARAQITTPTVQTPVAGAGHDYINLLSETVNPADGSLSLTIQLPTPKGRGISLPFALTYNSSVVQISSYQPGYTWWITNPKAGWSNSLPYLSWWNSEADIIVSEHPPLTDSCYMSTGYEFYDATGGAHNLNMAGVSAAPNNGTYDDCADPNGGAYQFSPVFNGGDSQVKSTFTEDCGNGDYTSGNGGQECNYANPPVEVLDGAGTIYHFPANFTSGSGGSPAQIGEYPTSIEDRNGNIISFSGALSGPLTATDTAGRAVVSLNSPSGTGPTTITAGTLTYSVQYKPSTSYSYSVPEEALPPPTGVTGTNTICSFPLTPTVWTATGSSSNISTLALPNGQQYTFQYDPIYGLLNEIDYPDGGWVKYTWGFPGTYSTNALFAGSQNNGTGPTLSNACNFLYSTPVIISRKVSFGGSSNPSLTQTFQYATAWGTGSSNNYWTSKTTTVATTDAVTGLSAQTVYTYFPYYTDPAAGYDSAGQIASQIPLEQTVQYSDWGTSTAIRTDVKSWYDQFNLQSVKTTIDNGTSEVTYQYGFGGAVTQKNEYDFGSGSPGPLLRQTTNSYQTFPVNPLFPLMNDPRAGTTSTLLTFPCRSVVQDGSGNPAAETDYLYDGGTAVCGVAGTPSVSSVPGGVPNGTHDETNYSTNSSISRGNITTAIRKCFPNCSDTTTTYGYDATGQIVSMTDPGNHTTQYSYTDNPPMGNSTGNSNAYLTQITYPQTNGINHIESFSYAYSDGQLTQSVDENGHPTNYFYNDPLRRFTEVDLPTDSGGTTMGKTISYNDAYPPVVTTTQYATPDPSIITTSQYDGLGHVTKTQLISDPEGTDTTDTSYDGFGRVYTVSNPHRSASSPTDGTTTYTYDPLGRTTLVTKQDGNTAQTDYSAFPMVKVTDETGHQRQSITDALGRLIEVDEPRAAGDPVANYDVMQSDGNLVVYAQGGVPEWASGTWQTSSGGSYVLDMQNDGNLVLYKTYSLWGSNTVQSAQGPPYATPGCTNIGSALSQGQSLATGSCLVSPAGRYELVMQGDGNLVLYDLSHSPITSLWSSVTAGTGASYAVMQTDGNFVLYKQGGIPVPWSTNTWQSSPQGSFFIVMQDDGNLVVYNTYSLWDSDTVQSGGSAGPYPAPSCSNIGWQLAEGQTLSMNSCLVSPSGRYELVLQSDGNLVLYDLSTGAALWNSGTQEFTPFTYPYITRYSYDALGNLLCVEQHGDQGGTGCASAPTNDASSGWRVRRFTYDSLSRLLSSNNPESGTASYSYAVDTNCNPGGEELLSATDARGVAKNNCYDALHRLTAVTYSDATPPTSIAYDMSPWGFPVTNAIGRMTQSTSPSVAQILSYDSMGRVVTQWNCVPSNCNSTIGTYATSAVHDLAGNLTHLTYPDGRIVDYQIDPAGRTYHVSSSGNTFLNVSSFWPGGQWQNAAYGNGASTADTYNKRLQPSELKLMNGGNTPVVDLNYSWSGCDGSTGNNGNLCGISDAVNSNHNQTYSYDLLNRLSTASEADGAFNQTFSYDPWGNMSYSGGTGGSTSYSLQNRVAAYCHDQSGNILDYVACPATGPHQFAWNGAGRLSAVTAPNPASYTYDGDGNRVRKDAGSSWTEYVHFNEEPIAENSATGWTDYIFAGSKRIAEISAGNTQYYWADHLQSPRVMLDSSGNAQCYDTYTPFGSEVGTCAMTHYKFTGKERDTESGLDFFGARFYSSTMGRFISPDWSEHQDPIPYADLENPQTLNLYAYVKNDPPSLKDSTGHSCDPDTSFTDEKGVVHVVAGKCNFDWELLLSGLVPRGHHYIPQAIWKNINKASQAYKFLNRVATGALKNPRLSNSYDRLHRALNRQVDEVVRKLENDLGKSLEDFERGDFEELGQRLEAAGEDVQAFSERLLALEPEARTFGEAMATALEQIFPAAAEAGAVTAGEALEIPW